MRRNAIENYGRALESVYTKTRPKAPEKTYMGGQFAFVPRERKTLQIISQGERTLMHILLIFSCFRLPNCQPAF